MNESLNNLKEYIEKVLCDKDIVEKLAKEPWWLQVRLIATADSIKNSIDDIIKEYNAPK